MEAAALLKKYKASKKVPQTILSHLKKAGIETLRAMPEELVEIVKRCKFEGFEEGSDIRT